MSLRKFMHPRNRYKKVPDFKQLAVLYPEFRKVAVVDLTGKIKIDFKNENSLRVLTETLLKHDFNLDVKIPPNKLVPTLPLRLNYILWIEDLMKHASFAEMEDIMGIDIGTGAVCIYLLLFAKMYSSRMTGTEVDETSVASAVEHTENNKLQHLIKILKVNGETILKDAVEEQKTYHFSMCNPPFFETEGIQEKTAKRQPPRNAPTGNEGELMIEGGERKFVTNMIEESIQLKETIKIYTTMIGRRSNLFFLVKLLKKHDIKNLTWTEFCQGHTKRWGLAWTFLPKDNIDLISAPVIRKTGGSLLRLLNDQRPIDITFPMEDRFSSLDNVVNFLQQTMDELNIQTKDIDSPVDDFDGWSYQLTAKEDTWSHARRKRRLAQRQTNQNEIKNSENAQTSDIGKVVETAEHKGDSEDPLLVCNFYLETVEDTEVPEKCNFKILMTLEKGHGGKNALETFRQYLINKLGVRDYFLKQCSKPNKRKRKRLKKSTSDTCESDTNSERNVTCQDTSTKSSPKSS